LVLPFDLGGVIEMLQRTAAAAIEPRAIRLDALGRSRDHFFTQRFVKTPVAPDQPSRNGLAWKRTVHEHGLVAVPPHAAPVVREIADFNRDRLCRQATTSSSHEYLFLVSWLAGWLVGWLAGWLVSWLAG